MTPELFIVNAINPALRLLPLHMDSTAARAMLLAIAFQEARLKYRLQVGPIAYAHGYFQFERGGGIHGILTHPKTAPLIKNVLAKLDYPFTEAMSFDAIEHNDILSVCFARLLLYTVPQALPTRVTINEGWRQYYSTWRPGKPIRSTWDAFYEQGWVFASMASINQD